MTLPDSMATTTPNQLEALPAWARELSEKYYSGVTAMFVLHGNVRDLAPWKRTGGAEFLPLQRFLRDALFGARDLVLERIARRQRQVAYVLFPARL